METELISVIVPVYNVERYLRRCVDSILHQTYQDLEVLLVDDGSTDASGAICDEYAAQEERVTAVHQKNGGLSAARNAGLERAQGTYLCFVDSDDFLDSRMLETLCRDLQEQDADVAVVGFRMFEREEELAPAELTVPVQCMTGREAIRSTLVSDELGDFAWNKLYKRELFREALQLLKHLLILPASPVLGDPHASKPLRARHTVFFSSVARSYTARCRCIITISARTASFTAET